MSEENQNTEQIAPTTESDDNVDYKALYLEQGEKLSIEVQNAKKLRKRAQESEQSLTSHQTKAEESRKKELMKNEKNKELADDLQKQLDSTLPFKEKWEQRESQERERLLAKLPEEDREKLSQKDIDTLEYIVSMKEQSKPANPQFNPGKSRNVGSYTLPEGNIFESDMTSDALKSNWQGIVSRYTDRKN